jgi:hypothetical protein
VIVIVIVIVTVIVVAIRVVVVVPYSTTSPLLCLHACVRQVQFASRI